MQARELKAGDVVQIDPNLQDCFFPGCFMLVTEVKSWGAVGYIPMPQTREVKPTKAYFRCKWEDMEMVGRSVWVPVEEGHEQITES